MTDLKDLTEAQLNEFIYFPIHEYFESTKVMLSEEQLKKFELFRADLEEDY